MAITEIRSLRAIRLTESLGEKGRIQVTATEELLVLNDIANPSFKDIADDISPYAPYNAPVPRIGLRLLYGGYQLVCSNRQWAGFYEDNERAVKVVVEYTAVSDEQEQPEPPQQGDSETWQNITLESYAIEKPLRGWATLKDAEEADEDKRQAAINKAGDPVDGLTYRVAGLRMTYTNTKVEDPDFDKILEYQNACNQDSWLGGDYYTIRVDGYRAEYDQKNQTWSVSVEFVYDPDGHEVRYLNAGYNEKVGTTRRAIVDTNGNVVSKPVPLTTSGAAIALQSGTDPFNESDLVYLVNYPYPAKNFDNIFTECRI
jgi:hypothetical protein